MDDLNDYSWCAFYPAAARALCSYQNKRAALLKELYEALPAETGYLHDPERKPLKDIDPFSVFGILNRHISQEKKTETAEAFKRIFGLKEPVPHNYHGIPPLSNENSMFFGFKDGQTEKDIDNLWQFFISVLNDESSVGVQFDEMTAHQYGIKFNLTIGMYWIRPEKYFPLDTPSRAFLERHGIKCSSTSVPAFKDYEQICTGVRDLLPSLPNKPKSFAQVTRGIYLSLQK